MNARSPALLARVEAAGIRASATPHERELDGWLVREAPSRAKRSRCINALASGTGELDAKIAACAARYRAAALPPVFRITPFSQPASLDAELDARGWRRFDETLVMVATALDAIAVGMPAHQPRQEIDVRAVTLSHAAFADWSAASQGWSPAEARELTARLEHGTVHHQNVALVASGGQIVAAGQMAVDGDLAGFYSLFTVPALRRRGHARQLCDELVGCAVEQGATAAYLQVESTNHAAQHLYTALGFVEAYRYHYRDEPKAAPR